MRKKAREVLGLVRRVTVAGPTKCGSVAGHFFAQNQLSWRVTPKEPICCAIL